MVDTDNSTTRAMDRLGTAEIVVRAAHEMVLELQQYRRGQFNLTTNTHLERDLGLDSLSRVELFHRLGRELDVDIPDEALTKVESLGDLAAVIDAVGVGHGRTRLDMISRDRRLEPVTDLPLGTDTLVGMLDWHVRNHPERPHFCFIHESGVETASTYAELRDSARKISEGLARRDLVPGQTVAIMLPTCPEFFSVFFGILMAGGIPVPIYPPARLSQVEEHLKRQAAILRNAQVPILVTIEEAKHAAHFLRLQVKELRHVVTPEDVSVPPQGSLSIIAHEEDIAFLQYTSGSTGDPKGVALSHANLLANIRAMGATLEVESTDVFVSWLPLYHDMGLIGAWLGSMYHAVKFVVMPPLTFLARPERWLWAIQRHGGTLSAAPNFAYDLCAKRIDERDIECLDLNTWRIAANGAEPVSAATIEAFCARFKRYGFKPEALKPVYGLAECSVGLAFPPLEDMATIDRIDRDQFSLYGEAVPAKETPNPLSFVACGRALPGHEIRIVDEAGRELPEGREGRLQFRGPSTTRGYYRNREATENLFDNDWLVSGDLAYTRHGDIFITGRHKDLIIKAGRNIYAQELERAVGEIAGIRMGCVAVFGVHDAAAGTEKLVIMAETRERLSDRLHGLRSKVESVTIDIVGSPVDEVVLVPPQTVLKTSSGKIRRVACRMAYESEGAAMTRRAVWQQFIRLSATSVLPQLRRILRSAVEAIYAGWWWLVLGIVAVVIWLPVTLVPMVSFCRCVVRLGIKLFVGLVGIQITIEGQANLPPGAKVLVSNHSSYLDGLILLAALPGDYHFVAKKELKNSIWTGPFLSHLGTKFVERFDAQRGVGDLAELRDSIAIGDTLVFFPEGTFRRVSGLLPFRSGAFACAAQGGVALVPLALMGTRHILRSESWFPRWGQVQIKIDQPLEPSDSSWSGVLELRDRTRERMLELSGEPDLVYETGVLHTVKEEAKA